MRCEKSHVPITDISEYLFSPSGVYRPMLQRPRSQQRAEPALDLQVRPIRRALHLPQLDQVRQTGRTLLQRGYPQFYLFHIYSKITKYVFPARLIAECEIELIEECLDLPCVTEPREECAEKLVQDCSIKQIAVSSSSYKQDLLIVSCKVRSASVEPGEYFTLPAIPRSAIAVSAGQRLEVLALAAPPAVAGLGVVAVARADAVAAVAAKGPRPAVCVAGISHRAVVLGSADQDVRVPVVGDVVILGRLQGPADGEPVARVVERVRPAVDASVVALDEIPCRIERHVARIRMG